MELLRLAQNAIDARSRIESQQRMGIPNPKASTFISYSLFCFLLLLYICEFCSSSDDILPATHAQY